MGKKIYNKGSVNDTVVLIYMKDEMGGGITIGTSGTIKRIVDDPFEPEAKIYEILWENGSTLSLLSGVDIWYVGETTDNSDKKQIKESIKINDWERMLPILTPKINITKIYDFLVGLRNSGIVNMNGAIPFMYSGGDFLENYSSLYDNDIENFDELKEMAEESKNALIQLALKTLEDSEDKYDLSKINRTVIRLAKLAFEYYMIRFKSK